MEKLLNILVPLFALSLLGYLWASAHFKLKNYYSLNCQAAAARWKGWRVIGNLLLVGAIYFGYQAWLGMKANDLSLIFGLGICTALAFCSFAGFKFDHA